jgi:hypothetical protein
MNKEPQLPERENTPIKTEPATAADKHPRHPRLRRLFNSKAAVRQAMLAHEILGPSKSERRNS